MNCLPSCCYKVIRINKQAWCYKDWTVTAESMKWRATDRKTGVIFLSGVLDFFSSPALFPERIWNPPASYPVGIGDFFYVL